MLERILFKQMSVYFSKFLSDQQCGFQKEYTMQHCVLNLLEKWKNSFDKDKYLELYLQISQRGFVSIMSYLLQNSRHIDLLYLYYDYDYLSNRKQRIKTDDNYSSLSEILFGISQ